MMDDRGHRGQITEDRGQGTEGRRQRACDRYCYLENGVCENRIG